LVKKTKGISGEKNGLHIRNGLKVAFQPFGIKKKYVK
jgi:hypothetical protein